jgi:predicted amidohydrolase/glucose/arabinose dehydrogenase/cytochrome c551/c552
MITKLNALAVLILFAATLVHGDTGSLPPPEDFAVETVAQNLSNPMEMSIADNIVFIAELHGYVKAVNLTTGQTRVGARFEVDYRKKGKKWSWDVESGVLGIAVDPDFPTNKWVYVCYTRPGGESVEHEHTVSRFRYRDGMLDRSSEQVILNIPSLRDQDRIHESGSLAFGPDGNLYIGSGDNQVHTRYLYSARTSTNSAVLNGKILRVRPGKDGGYTIPPGNLFPPDTPNTRPEIYVMGCRNPFRISVDQRTGHLYWGENGPADYYCGNLKNVDKKLLPLGFDEFNQARQAGFFGWPFLIGENEPYPTYAFDTNTVTGAFDAEKPINYLKENTGVKELPPAQRPMIWYSHPPSPDFPMLGRGGASAIAGPVYYHDPTRKAEAGGLPKAFDHHWFIADYARGWVKVVQLDDAEKMVAIKAFPAQHRFQTPINLKFNRDGQLFVLQYGKGGWDGNNGGSLLRISHRPGAGGLATSQPVLANTLGGLPEKHPGTALIRQNNCAACHRCEGALIGPSFKQIIDKYGDVATRNDYLKKKIREGSKGVWGKFLEMPGHSYLKDDEVEQVVKAIFALKLADHAARNRPVTLAVPPSPRYPGSGGAELVDGVFGDEGDLKSNWLGFEGPDLTATIDLGKTMPVRELALSACQVVASGVFLPPQVEFLVSSDGKDFRSVAVVTHDVPIKRATDKRTLSAKIDEVQARYVRVKAKSVGTIPQWHKAKGLKAWLFVDEILVNPAEPGQGSPAGVQVGPDNLIENGDFQAGAIGGLPEGWSLTSATPALAPVFKLAEHDGKKLLMATGGGNADCTGYLSRVVSVPKGKSYLFTADFRMSDGLNPHKHLLFRCLTGSGQDGIFSFRKLEQGWVRGEAKLALRGEGLTKARIQLFFRHSANGKAWIRNISLAETEADKPRWVKVATTHGKMGLEKFLAAIDEAGKAGADIILLPEYVAGMNAEPVPGPTSRALSEKARQHNMYIGAGIIRQVSEPNRRYNTALLIDREGEVVGMYDKIHLYSPESNDQGFTPGRAAPVFDTDFGRVGFMICYDSWFTDVAQLLALKGAEIILFPNAGHQKKFIHARAGDNCVRIVNSALNRPASIYDTVGRNIEEGDFRTAPSPNMKTYRNIVRKNLPGVQLLIAELDLNNSASPAYNGGTMMSAPGGKRNRREQLFYLQDEIKKELHRWWEE